MHDHTDANVWIIMLILHNECGLGFAVSLFVCNVPSELKRVVRVQMFL